MAYIIEGTEYPVVYIANYRVGSTATAATLMDMGARQVNHHHGLPDLDDLIPSALIVQTVRHHCDALVSYWFKLGQRWPLEDLVKRVLNGDDEFFKPTGFYNRYPCNYVLRYETLQYEFDNLCLNAGLPITKLKVDPSKRPPNKAWQEVMFYHLAERVYKAFKEEMDFCGYSIDRHVPAR